MTSWLTDAIGTAAAVLSTVCWLPQSIKTIRDKDTSALSLSANLLLLSAVGLWLVYGLALDAWPLIVANGISLVLVGIIVVMKLRHG